MKNKLGTTYDFGKGLHKLQYRINFKTLQFHHIRLYRSVTNGLWRQGP